MLASQPGDLPCSSRVRGTRRRVRGASVQDLHYSPHRARLVAPLARRRTQLKEKGKTEFLLRRE